MNILNLEAVGRTIGESVILDNVTVGINEGDRIGVIGINGAGKSTLLSVTAGVSEPDTGQVVRRRQLKISFLPQNPVFDTKQTVLQNVVTGISGQEAHWDTEGEARAMLFRLGIENPDISPAILSGGQKKRAALATALLTPCDLLILDEPTNHLDYSMVEWLQEWLEGFPGALLMVTHDRYFLDEVTERIWELDHGKLYSYTANYSGYLEKKQERLDFALAAERKMAALYKKDLAWMQRGARARSTKQKAHIQRFETLRDREKIAEERQVQMASLSSRLGGKTVELREISKSFGNRCLFRDFSYIFLKADRIGIIGQNGCGKSTLMRVILGLESADSGSVEIGQTVKFGYFSQENEHLNENARVLDYVREAAEFIRTEEGLISASAMCERFLFDSRMQYTPIAKLSGGEKRRLYLLRVLMEAPNVLILDEPTNDLDIQTLQILEDYLDGFAGIVIVVSHDRYFLDRVVTRIFAFEEGGVLQQNEGGYEEYRERKLLREGAEGLKEERGNFGERSAARETKENGDSISSLPGDSLLTENAENTARGKRTAHSPKNRLSYKEEREYEGLEALIDSLTAQAAELEEKIVASATDFLKLQQLTEEKAQTDKLLEEKIERYLELQEKVEAMQS